MTGEALKGHVKNVFKFKILYIVCFIILVTEIILSDSNTFFHFYPNVIELDKVRLL